MPESTLRPLVLRWISQSQHRYQMLALSLLALYAALVTEPGSPLHATFVLIHFAAVIVWQPFLRGTTQVAMRSSILALAAATVVALWMNWLLLTCWLLLLIGMIGGENARRRHDQIAQWLIIGFLFVVLLTRAVPNLFVFETDELALRALAAASALLPIGLLFLSAHPAPRSGPRFDLLRSLSITIFALLLAAASALWTYRSGSSYPRALIDVLLAVGVVILVLDWLWRRRSGHTLFQVLLDRYLLNLGSPFEHYLQRLSGPAARGLDPDAYLDRSIAALEELDWVRGVETSGSIGARLVGERTEYVTWCSDNGVQLAVYTDRDPGPALRLHIQLLARLILQLYESRCYEADQREQAKARAVYETGARLTHDIKNLLQSLQSLSAAVSASRTHDSDEALGLVQRQLPHINRRLQATIEKLRDPAETPSQDRMHAAQWWRELQQRYGDGSVEFHGEGEGAAETELPRELFDTVAENLLENARYKQSIDRQVRIRAELSVDGEHPVLRVTDTGAPVPEETARHLFGTAINSAQGLGIGLHQCARLAHALGYELRLETNQPGNVCFCLGAA